jgi:hypothetical protein
MITEDQHPAAVVQRQLDAYNRKDVDALVELYAGDAEILEQNGTVLASGSAALRARFAARFQEPNLHAALLHRAVCGSMVVDHERVTRTLPDGPGSIDLVMIYEVRCGRIARSWVLPGEVRLDPR